MDTEKRYTKPEIPNEESKEQTNVEKRNKSQSDIGIFSHLIFIFESSKQTLN